MSFDPDRYLREQPGLQPKLSRPSGEAPPPQPAPSAAGGIAVIGMAGRFPGARNIDEFWENLHAGRESITFFSESELEGSRWMKCGAEDPDLVRAAGILEDADCFDAEFFGCSPREADFMDPQQRVFLESCWSAIESAGYNPLKMPGAVGVFGSTMYSTYLWMIMEEANFANPAERMQTNIGNMQDSLATRVAYKLNLKGPALTVQTACSSSLVAVAMACESLQQGKCDAALAGGVSIVFPQKSGYIHNSDLIDSKDGHCRAFSEGATGTIFSNGVGVVLLKRLEDARRDGDPILAVILGSAINNDGREKIGYTAPSVAGQAEVIRRAMLQGGVKPETISYIEAHGTGTPLGDPIEIEALNLAFAGVKAGAKSCPIGSLKTNMGHLTAAAGVAGLIKTVLALQHREIPANLNFSAPNPAIPFDQGPFYVNQQRQAWKAGNGPRRAGVSSFGVGGTNAHLVVEEAPVPIVPARPEPPACRIVTLSARTAAALKQKLEQLAVWLRAQREWPEIASLAYTLNAGRAHFAHRAAFVAWRSEELLSKIEALLEQTTDGDSFLGDAAVPGAGGEVIASSTASTEPHASSQPGNSEDSRERLRALARDYAQGGEIDWEAFHAGERMTRISLPTYPFAKEKHWWRGAAHRAVSKEQPAAAKPSVAPAAAERSARTFQRTVRRGDSWVSDHQVLGQPVFPGVGYLIMAVAAAESCGRIVRSIEEAHWLRPLKLDAPEVDLEIQLKAGDGRNDFTVSRQLAGGRLTHAAGTLSFSEPKERPKAVDIPAVQSRCAARMPPEELYRRFADRGVIYGAYFRRMVDLWRGENEVLAQIELPPGTSANLDETGLHPGLLDAALQSTAAFAKDDGGREGQLFLPYSVKSVELFAPLTPRIFARAIKVEGNHDAGSERFDLWLLDERGEVLIRIIDFCTRAAKSGAASGLGEGVSQRDPHDHEAAPPAMSGARSRAAEGPGETAARREYVQNTIRRQVAAVLSVPEEELDFEQSHTEVGVDSLLAVEIVKSINDHFGLALRATDLFNYSNLRELASRVLELSGERPFPQAVRPPASLASPPPAGPGLDCATVQPIPRETGGDLWESIESTHARAEKTETPRPTREAGSRSSGEIAIIGMAGRFPDADDVNEFWANLKAGKNSVREIPGDRWDYRALYDPDPRAPNKSASKWGGFLRGVDQFDPAFFNLSPKEAAMMDPQQRLFLEEAWKALEDAGYHAANLAGSRCGVFAGVGPADYSEKLVNEGVALSAYAFTGNAVSILAARIAYFLNLKGPCVAVDTACSSSLVAVHLGCQSILAGDSEMVLAGGVYLMLTPRFQVLFSKAGMLSPDGACKTFDESANGMVPGEGAGVVVLKRLDRAMADGDAIYGVIKASGINQDGRTNGITAPSSLSQTALELEVYQKAGLNPETITLLEAHGTGTRLGDPIELHALADAFERHTARKQFCAIGSVKTNIGHLMTAAGVASLIKILLSLTQRQMPPSLHFRRPNGQFNFPESPFFVNTVLRDWLADPGHLRRAAISSFGFSGTNAHLLVEEPPAVPVRGAEPKRIYLLAISAATEAAFERRLAALEPWLGRQEPGLRLDDLSYTLNCRRHHFQHRAVFLVEDAAALSAAIRQVLRRAVPENCFIGGTAPGDKTGPAGAAAQLVQELAGISTADSALISEKLKALAKLYVEGADVPWREYYREGFYRCLRMPVYPFERQRCWFTHEDIVPGGARLQPPARLHPLVDALVPDLGYGVVFSKKLTSSEAVVSDHRVQGQCLLPAAAFLEMARAAAELARANSAVGKLREVGWLFPIVASAAGSDLEVKLTPHDGELVCEITSGSREQAQLHYRSRVVFQSRHGAREGPVVDLEALRSRCRTQFGKREIYAGFGAGGIIYGDWFQVIENLYGSPNEALAEIVLPSPAELAEYALHPAILDAALQTTAGILSTQSDVSAGTYLPSSVEEIEIFGKLPARSYAYACLAEAGPDLTSRRYHIALLSDEGQVLVKLRNFCLRLAPELKGPLTLSPLSHLAKGLPGLLPLPAQSSGERAGGEGFVSNGPEGASSHQPSPPLRGGEGENSLPFIAHCLNSTAAGPELRGKETSPGTAPNFLYRPIWEPELLPAPSEPAAEGGGKVRVLLVRGACDFGLGKAIVELHGNQEVVSVFLGERFDRVSQRTWALDASSLADWERLAGEAGPFDIIYFLGGLRPVADQVENLRQLEQSQEKGVLSLLRLARAFHLSEPAGPLVQLKIITTNLHAVHPDDPPHNPCAASLAGFAKVLGRECGRVAVNCVDLSREDLSASDDPAVILPLLRLILSERARAAENEVAYRAGRRYVRKIVPVSLKPLSQEALPLRERGVYLILGGAGGIGLEVSKRLAQSARARLILIGRKPLDSARLAQIEAISDLGGEVLYLEADGTNLEAMTGAVRQARARFGPINGVIHSAVVLRDASIKNMDDAAFRAAFDPKVAGSWVLHEVTREEPLDFFVFFSSASSLFGNPGQSNYAAGCAYADSFGLWLARSRKRPVKIINWGFWGEVGIVASETYRRRLARQGVQPLTRVEGIDAFERILAGDETQVVAIKLDGEAFKGLNSQRLPELANDRSPVEPLSRLAISAARSRVEAATPLGELLVRAQESLEAYARLALLQTFQNAGIGFHQGESFELEEWQTRLGTIPVHRRLFRALCEILEKGRFVRIDGSRITVVASPAGAGQFQSMRLEVSRTPAALPFVRLLDVCLEALPKILRGEVGPLDVLFPGGSAELVEAVYRGNPTAEFYNQVIADVVGAAVAELRRRAPEKKLRLLEVGAGTGGATGGIVSRLEPYGDHLEYHYTDISPIFTRLGQKNFGHQRFVRFGVVDIEKDLRAQNLREGWFDLVVASNVLHATRDLRQTVRQVKRLFGDGGLLVLNEGTRELDFVTITFGLTEGWWRFADFDLRRGHSPLISSRQWRELLSAEGFREVQTLGLEGVEQQVIFGETGREREAVPATESSPVLTDRASAPAPAKENALPLPDSDPALFQRAAEFIWKNLAQVLKADRHELERGVDAISFDKYGITSLITLELITALEKDFGPLPKTLLFEQTNLRSLVDYFFAHHRAALLEKASSAAAAPLMDAAQLFSATAATPAAEGLLPLPAQRSGERAGGEGFVSSVPEGASSPRPSPPLRGGEGESSLGFIAHGPDSPAPAWIFPAVQDIAIIGVSGRYPQAGTLDEFWASLRDGRSCISEVPPERWKPEKLPPRAEELLYSRRGGFIRDADKFDPLFFNISPREAEAMDPQERIFLETAWGAAEDAGYCRAALSGPMPSGAATKTGVFAGVMYGSYQLFGAEQWAKGRYVTAGSGYWSIANRVSYALDLHGPSLAIDTACSSSLTAIHLACESLRRGECHLALAGGVNLILHPIRYLDLCQMKMLSPDDTCRPFGKGANGFVDGEGVGAVLLKPLSKAVADRDHIYAVIKGSAINAGGRTNSFTVPNPNAQASVVADALAQAQIDPRTLSYLEAHGTGTSLGDPIEIAGLVQAFRPFTSERQFCAIGSSKSNIGHLEAAAGIAALTKVLLMMKHRKLVPSIHADELNPFIQFEQTPFQVQRTLQDWPRRQLQGSPLREALRRAGISSFGAGGANAHLILEEYAEAPSPAGPAPGTELIVLSAKNRERLQEYAVRLQRCLEARPAVERPSEGAPPTLGDMAYTLQTGREAFDERLAILAGSAEELLDKLKGFVEGRKDLEGVFAGNVRANPHRLATLQASAEETDFLQHLQRAGQWGKIASFWVAGSEVPWAELSQGRNCHRVPLPTYPFARERYWIPDLTVEEEAMPAYSLNGTGSLHPLIDRNISTLKEIRFVKAFTRADRILADHQVLGRPVLPAVACLEMVRAAAQLSADTPVSALSQVVWIEPIIADQLPLKVYTSLKTGGERLQFEIWTEQGGGRRVHARGKVTLRAESRGNASPISIAEVQARCSAQYKAVEVYQFFAGRGLEYGPSFQAVQNLWANGEEALASLSLPGLVAGGYPPEAWHPSLIDAALQATVGLVAAQNETGLHLPFSLREVCAHHPLPRACYAYVRLSKPANVPRAPMQKFQIRVVDEQGIALLEIADFTARLAVPERERTSTSARIDGNGASAAKPKPAVEPDGLNQLLGLLAGGRISIEEAEESTSVIG